VTVRVGVDARILDRPGMERSGVGRYALEATRALASVRPDWELEVHSNRSDLFDERVRLVTTHWPTERAPGRIAWLHAGSRRTSLVKVDALFGTAFVLPVWWRGPSVVTIHDLMFVVLRDKYRGRLNAAYASAATRWAARHASAVVCGSQETSALLQRTYGLPGCRVVVVPYGVSPAFRFTEPRDETSVQDDPYLLFVGTFEARKGLGTIRDALREHGLEGVRVVLAGRPGWQVEDVLAELRGDPRVSEEHEPSDDRLAQLYRSALAMIYPSEMEGFGLPVAEAMSAGVPVVASGLDCIREFAADAPLYVRPGDGQELSAHVGRLREDAALRRTHTDRGRLYSAALTWDSVGERTAQAIERSLV